MVSEIIEELNGRHILGGFNYNKSRDIFKGFRDGIMNYIGGGGGFRLSR